MQSRTRIRGLAAASVASLAVAGFLTTSAVPAAAGETRHCSVDLATGVTACAADGAQSARLAGIGPQAVLAVTLYDTVDFTGVAYSMYVSAPCSPEHEFEHGIADLGAFSNRTSAVRTANQCEVRLHDPINYGSPYSDWIGSSSNLGNVPPGWDNRASSIVVS